MAVVRTQSQSSHEIQLSKLHFMQFIPILSLPALFCCYSVIIIITNDSCSFIHVTALFYRPMHYNRTVEIDSNCAVRTIIVSYV